MPPHKRITAHTVRRALIAVETDPARYAITSGVKQLEIWPEETGTDYEREQLVLRQVSAQLRTWGFETTGITLSGNGSRLCLDWSGPPSATRELILANVD